MRKLLLKRALGLCLMLVVFATNRAWASTDGVSTFDELKLGDWFVIKQTKPSDRVDEEFSSTWRGTVINRTEQELTVEFVLTHLFQLSPTGNGRMRETNYYSDIYFLSNPPKITMTRSLLADGLAVVDITLSDTILHYGSKDYLYGLKNSRKEYGRGYGGEKLSINSIADQINYFLLQDTPVSLANVDLVEASFRLTPNTTIYYKLDGYKQKSDPKIYRDDDPYNVEYLTKETNNTYSISLHLGGPTKMWVDSCYLWLSPGDSLVITKNKKEEVTFSGKGAEICEVSDKIRRQTRSINKYLFFVYSYMDVIAESIEEIELLYKEKLYPNKSKIDPYWYQSAILSLDYLESTALLGYAANVMRPKKIDDWAVSPFDKICPIIDYRYQPEFYNRFIIAFYRYTCKVLNENNLTNKMYWRENRGSFYLVEQLFDGYLRSYLWFENLKERLQMEKYSILKEEFSVFYRYCFYPELVNRVKKLETHYATLENGRNIKELDVDFIKQLPLKKKADGYILLTVSKYIVPNESSSFSKIESMLINENLKKEVKLVNIRNEHDKKEIEEHDKYGYIWLAPEKYERFGISFNTIFVLRNDGTIIGRANLHQDVDKEIKDIILNDKEEIAQASLPSRKQLYGALGVLLVICLVAGVYYNSRIRKQKLQTRLSQLKLKAIRSQMNPHFIFNALTSIQSLILRNDTEKANRYLITFSRMLRNVLTSSEKTLIALSDELKLVEQYLQIEQLRMPIEYNLEVASDICTDDIEIPGMLLQPIVENAVIHGLFPQKGGVIDIRLWIENNNLWCEIVDNGVGIKASSDKNSKFGLYSIQERLTLLDNSKASQLRLSVANRADEENTSGCRVKIMIPL